MQTTDLDEVSSPPIPPEIQEHVILSIDWEDSDLIKASLVCQHWYTVAMQKFWAHRAFRIYGRGKSYALRWLLENPKCRFIRHVQHLVIDGRSPDGDDVYYDIRKTVDLMAKFTPYPRSIRLEYMRYTWLFPQTLRILKSFKEVSSLELYDMTYTSPGEFLNSLNIFDSLRYLAFKSCFVTRRPMKPAPFPDPDLSSLQRLNIGITPNSADDLIRYLLTRPCTVERLKLSLETKGSEGGDVAARLLSHIGPALKSLHLNVFPPENILRNSPFQLTNNTSLTYLSVESILIASDRRYDCSWLGGLIESINSSVFRHLRVGFLSEYIPDGEGHYGIHFKNFNWNSIDNTLTGSSYFDHWKTVEIWVKQTMGYELEDENVEGQFRENLPKLNGSGKLVVIQETIGEEED